MSKKLVLDVEDSLWEQFKTLVPREQSLHDAVVSLIVEKVNLHFPEKEASSIVGSEPKKMEE